MTRHYYAMHHRYGSRTVSADTLRPCGSLHIFGSRRERDEWVGADEWDGGYHRTAYTAAEARRDMVDEIASMGIIPSQYGDAADLRRHCPQDDLIKLYKQIDS